MLRAVLILSLSIFFSSGAVQAANETGPAAEREALYVRLDEASLLRLSEQAATLVIGNPAIADASVNDGRTIIITGKSFGTTNVIAINRRGEVIAERQIWVQSPQSSIVTMQRGDENETYSCSPLCRRTPIIGDTTKGFTEIINQAQTRNGLAQSQAASR